VTPPTAGEGKPAESRAQGRVVRNVLWLALDPALRVLVAIPLAGFTARQLGVTGYGQLSFALAFAGLLGAANNLGLNEVLQREVARQPPDLSPLWSTVWWSKLVPCVVYVASLVALAGILGHDWLVVTLIALMGAYLGLVSLDNSARAVFAGKQEMSTVARLDIAKLLAEVGLTVSVLLAGAGVLGLGGARVLVGAAGGLATTWLAFRRFGLRITAPAPSLLRPLLLPALSFAGIAAVRMVNSRAGVLVLEQRRGLDEVALFTAALMPVERIFLLIPVLESALFPFFAAMRRDQTEWFSSALARALRYQAVVAGGLGLGVSLLGPPALAIIFPRAFDDAGRALEVLGISVATRTLSTLLVTAMTARGLERRVVEALALQGVATVAMALAWTGTGGATGLAWATAVSDVLALLFVLAVLLRRGGLAARWPAVAGIPLALAAGLYLAFWLTQPSGHRTLWALLFSAAYPLAVLLCRVVSRDDLAYITAALRGRADEPRRPD
jgi:O-antigen/teichoic acid export membrane protein